MRQFKLLAVFALFSLSMLTGCFPTASSVTPSYSMTATAGGTQFTGQWVEAFSVPSVQNTLSIVGRTVVSGAVAWPEINLNIVNWTGGTGTFNLVPITGGGGTFTGTFAQYQPAENAITSNSGSGSIIITSVSASTIIGTFSFTCDDGTAVTGGSFVAKRS